MNWHPAPGKLNLFLHVLRRREDGYHELQTVFRLIERADRVGVALREDGEVRFAGVYGEDNLCFKAATLLKRECGTRLGCDLALEKHLPVGGGMGGGSSDAATVLLALNRLWKIAFRREKLMEIGLHLGADVPFFIFGRSALGEGIGERLSPLELPAAWYVVLTPQVSVSTKEIFAKALTGQRERLTIPPFFPGQGQNDLEPVVTARYPEVAAHLAWLKSRVPHARMTGSGACVFAEVKTESEARALQSQLPESMRGFIARGVAQHPMYDWAS